MTRLTLAILAAFAVLGIARLRRAARQWGEWADDDPETVEGQLVPMAAWNGWVGYWPEPLGRNN